MSRNNRIYFAAGSALFEGSNHGLFGRICLCLGDVMMKMLIDDWHLHNDRRNRENGAAAIVRDVHGVLVPESSRFCWHENHEGVYLQSDEYGPSNHLPTWAFYVPVLLQHGDALVPRAGASCLLVFLHHRYHYVYGVTCVVCACACLCASNLLFDPCERIWRAPPQALVHVDDAYGLELQKGHVSVPLPVV